MPMVATRGIIIGAIIAFAPANVPSNDTRIVELTIVVIIAFFSLSTPIFLTRLITRYSATPVFCKTAPRPEPSIMIKPIMPKKEPNDSAITPPNDENGCFVIIALKITQITTFNTGFRSLNDKTI